MTTINVDLDETRKAYVAAGLDEAQIDKLLAGLTKARKTAGLEVVLNEGDDLKYGDVSIAKVFGNGYRKNMMGLFEKDIPTVISLLQEAQEKLAAE